MPACMTPTQTHSRALDASMTCSSALKGRVQQLTDQLRSSESAALEAREARMNVESIAEEQIRLSKLQIESTIEASHLQALEASKQAADDLQRRLEALTEQLGVAEGAVLATREIAHPVETSHADLQAQQEATYAELLSEQSCARREAAAGEKARSQLSEKVQEEKDLSLEVERKAQQVEAIRQQLAGEREMRKEMLHESQREAALEIAALKENLDQTRQQLEQSNNDQQHLKNSNEHRAAGARELRDALAAERKEAQFLRLQLQRMEENALVPPLSNGLPGPPQNGSEAPRRASAGASAGGINNNPPAPNSIARTSNRASFAVDLLSDGPQEDEAAGALIRRTLYGHMTTTEFRDARSGAAKALEGEEEEEETSADSQDKVNHHADDGEEHYFGGQRVRLGAPESALG